MLDLFNHKLGVSTSIDDVDRMHRVGKKGDRKPGDVLVKFATYRAREVVFKAKRYLKPGEPRPTRNAPAWTAAGAAGLLGGPRPGEAAPDDNTARHDPAIPEPDEPFNSVYISEDLTEIRKHLLYNCRLARRAQKITDSWTYDGRVLIRDGNRLIHSIKTVGDLAKFGFVPPAPVPVQPQNVNVVS